jgi:hypothetical protein
MLQCDRKKMTAKISGTKSFNLLFWVTGSLDRPPTPEEVSEAVLAHLKSMLGPQVTAVLLRELQENYFGAEMDVRTAIADRPELFERAFAGVLGRAGQAILVIICKKIHAQFSLDAGVTYSKFGDLARCMATVRP